MSEYRAAVDIANRALDHCGQDPIDEVLGFAEQSKRARICGRVYDKLRQAELRRNVWRFAIRPVILRPLDLSTMLLVPSLWESVATYFVGSIVADEDGHLWTSTIPNNLGNQPEETGQAWVKYFGPMSVMLYDSTKAYSTGELVYATAGDGKVKVYVSLQNANADNPATATAWSATAVYFKNDVITFSAIPYMSRIDFNTNQTPTGSAAAWDATVTYGIGAFATGSDGVRYQSLVGLNLGNDPVTDGGANWLNLNILTPWTTVFVGGAGSVKWRQIGGTEFPAGAIVAPFNIVYPLGTGPSSQSTTRNVFRLPAGFLRKAATDPKAGGASPLGEPASLGYEDWRFEGQYIISWQVDAIKLRFVTDTTDVRIFDPMFCEGLAARIGMEVCQPLTQSSDKLKTIASVYTQHMNEARTVNGIETGPEEPPLDDYIMCRM